MEIPYSTIVDAWRHRAEMLQAENVNLTAAYETATKKLAERDAQVSRLLAQLQQHQKHEGVSAAAGTVSTTEEG